MQMYLMNLFNASSIIPMMSSIVLFLLFVGDFINYAPNQFFFNSFMILLYCFENVNTLKDADQPIMREKEIKCKSDSE